MISRIAFGEAMSAGGIALLNGGRVGLLRAPPVWGGSTIVIQEANFPGYSPIDPVAWGPFNDGLYQGGSTPSAVFTADGSPGAGKEVVGWYATSPGGNVQVAGTFDRAINCDLAGLVITLNAAWGLLFSGGYITDLTAVSLS